MTVVVSVNSDAPATAHNKDDTSSSSIEILNQSQPLTPPTQRLYNDSQTNDNNTNEKNEIIKLPICWGHIYYIYKGHTKRYDLSDDYYVIGRGDDAHIQIDYPECSKRHCGICYLRPTTDVEGGGACIIVDNSTNGTSLNDRQLLRGFKTRLKHGDVIDIRSGHRFIFHEKVGILEENEEEDLDPEFISIVGNDYLFVKRLGVGTYAIASKVVCRKTSVCYACKAVCKRKAGFNDRVPLTPRTLDSIPEIAAMKSLDHPNIVRIHDVRQTTRKLYIFMQLADGGDLFNYLVHESSIEEKEVQFIVYQILLALKYLHENKITHRDIKPENILLSKKEKFSRVFLGDFGLAKIIHFESKMKTMCGTLEFLAPEMMIVANNNNGEIQNNFYSSAIDCWAMGVMTFYLLGGYLPFENNCELDLRQTILKGKFSFNSDYFDWTLISNNCKDFIKNLLQCDPKKRLTVIQALNHPWISLNLKEIDFLYKKVTLDDCVKKFNISSPKGF